MTNNININTEELVQIFILSNTPYYLYKKFSAEVSIQKFSEKYSTDKLIKLFKREQGKDKTTYEDVVLFYAIIIALTKKPYREVKDFFLGLNNASFRWARQISEIYAAKRFPQSIVTYDAKYKSELSKNDFVSNANTSFSDYQQKPVIIRKE